MCYALCGILLLLTPLWNMSASGFSAFGVYAKMLASNLEEAWLTQ